MLDPNLLTEAAQEIRRLRQRNEVLAAKVEVFEMCAMMVHSQPPPQYGTPMAVDLAWRLDEAVREHTEGPKSQGPAQIIPQE